MKQIIKSAISLMLLALFLSACLNRSKNEGNEDIRILVNEWQGRKVVIPQDIVFTRYATDTIEYLDTNASYKVFVYVDSIGCLSCKLQLPKWKQVITELDSILNCNISYFFIFDTKKVQDVKELLEDKEFDYPVCIDVNSRLNELNKFLPDTRFHTFLLDMDNSIKVIGNPVRNLSILDLYKKALKGGNSEILKEKPTILYVPVLEKDLGVVSLGDVKVVSFSIKNVGDVPLIIKGVTTSCDCTSAIIDSHKVPVNESLKLSVNYKADTKGDFLRTVLLFCNTEDAPIEFVLTGKVM